MAPINVKEAVKAAKEQLLDLYSDDPPRSLALEEIEKVSEGGRDLWAVTLGFHRQKSVIPNNANSIASLYLPAPVLENRVYKTLFIDAQTGEFVKMDIRQVQ